MIWANFYYSVTFSYRFSAKVVVTLPVSTTLTPVSTTHGGVGWMVVDGSGLSGWYWCAYHSFSAKYNNCFLLAEQSKWDFITFFIECKPQLFAHYLIRHLAEAYFWSCGFCAAVCIGYDSTLLMVYKLGSVGGKGSRFRNRDLIYSQRIVRSCYLLLQRNINHDRSLKSSHPSYYQ